MRALVSAPEGSGLCGRGQFRCTCTCATHIKLEEQGLAWASRRSGEVQACGVHWVEDEVAREETFQVHLCAKARAYARTHACTRAHTHACTCAPGMTSLPKSLALGKVSVSSSLSALACIT